MPALLLAEELTLLAIDPESGRPAVGMRDAHNACLAGLLIGQLALDGGPGRSPALAAARGVLDEKGGTPKAALSHMDRGLTKRLGAGTWDTAVAGLVTAGVVAPPEGRLRPVTRVLRPDVRDSVLARLREAATSDAALDPPTALVLSMTGPAHLLEVVAPERTSRKHARRRIDHALDATDLRQYGESVRRVLADAQAAVIAATTAATVGAVAASS